MDKWIDELKQNGINFLNGNGALYEENDKIELTYCPANLPDEIDLNGTFKIDEIAKLLAHMKQYDKGRYVYKKQT